MLEGRIRITAAVIILVAALIGLVAAILEFSTAGPESNPASESPESTIGVQPNVVTLERPDPKLTPIEAQIQALITERLDSIGSVADCPGISIRLLDYHEEATAASDASAGLSGLVSVATLQVIQSATHPPTVRRVNGNGFDVSERGARSQARGNMLSEIEAVLDDEIGICRSKEN